MHIEVATPIFQGQTVTVSYTGGNLRLHDGFPVEFTEQAVTNGSTARKPSLGIERIGSGNVAEGGTVTYRISATANADGIWAPRPGTPSGITNYR